MADNLSSVSANAITPDQLLPYVRSVSGLESSRIASGILHRGGSQAVLVCYPPHAPLGDEAVDEAVNEVLKLADIETLTVLAAKRPAAAPENAHMTTDFYWQMPLPPARPRQKLRNMLKRADMAVNVTTDSGAAAWTDEHSAMAENFCRNKSRLDAGTIFLLTKLGDYLAEAADAVLFSARKKENGQLAAFAIGDFTALSTCFYMFACRQADSPPGTADLLLAQLAAEGAARGHARLNLGLGINAGVEFFKKKWGAEKFLPLVETRWRIKRKTGFFARLFGG